MIIHQATPSERARAFDISFDCTTKLFGECHHSCELMPAAWTHEARTNPKPENAWPPGISDPRCQALPSLSSRGLEWRSRGICLLSFGGSPLQGRHKELPSASGWVAALAASGILRLTYLCLSVFICGSHPCFSSTPAAS
jgi:hypothetical protein